MHKKLLSLSLLMSALTSSFAQQNVIDEIMWVVGDEAILLSEVEEQRVRAQYEGTKIDGNPYCSIPEQLALQKLYLDQAKLDSLEIDDKQVEQQVDQRVSYLTQQIGSKAQVEDYFGKPMEQIRETLSEMVRNQLTIQQEQHKIVGEVKPTPAELRRFYSKLPSDSIPSVPEQVEIQIISIQPKIRKEAIDKVTEKLHSYQERVEKGESSFSTLAILYSEDTESAKQGGELGYMGRGQLVQEYADVAFSLKDPKRVSRIVKSDFGYHIIQLIDRKDERVNTRHILLKPEIMLADRDSAKKALDSLANCIRLDKIKFEDAVALYSTDKNTRNCKGNLSNPRTDNTKFEIQELNSSIQPIVRNMNVGEISKPFAMKNANGDDVYTIVKLKNKIPTHKANLTDDYQLIKNVYSAQKSDEILKQWIVEKQKDVYVKIYDKYKDCDFEFPGWIKDKDK